MNETTENQVIVDTATTAALPTDLVEGQRYAFVVPNGGTVEVIDNDRDTYRDHPRRATGHTRLNTPASFVDYLAKHGLHATEVYADINTSKIIAIINAHAEAIGGDEPGLPGWGDHRATLTLTTTPAWRAWTQWDRKLLSQVDFAEHLEDRQIDVITPASADMLEMAQTFHATNKVAFDSSHRLSSGEVQLKYHEEVDAKAGRKGQLEIPTAFTIALAPFEGSDPYRVNARLRYRITDGVLQLGYVLDRPTDVLRAAFDDIATAVGEDTGRVVFLGTPA